MHRRGGFAQSVDAQAPGNPDDLGMRPAAGPARPPDAPARQLRGDLRPGKTGSAGLGDDRGDALVVFGLALTARGEALFPGAIEPVGLTGHADTRAGSTGSCSERLDFAAR